MISVENLSKSFGAQVLFDRVSFKINARERVGLVGRNGHGKTTLFRIIVGEEHAHEGTVTIPRDYRLGYVRQILEFSEDSVLKEGLKGLPPAEKDQIWKVEKVLSGLGFSREDQQRRPSEFSGGFQVRLNLAKVLVSDPDMLLLDEPTNYLDITSIRWVERYLSDWPHELLLITHDRSLMDKLVTHTMGIHRQKIRKVEGTTEKYYAQIAQEEEIYEKTRVNEEQRRKEIELFIARFRAKARLGNLVQSRVKTLAKMERKDRLEKIKDLEFSFRSKPYPSKYVMTVRHLTFGYEPSKPLINDLSFTVNAGDRICIVGSNGKGKTTLLRLLAGALSPWTGQIVSNPGVEPGIFEQTNVRSLVDARSVEEEILASYPGIDRQTARNICGAMMFEGDAALKKIQVLSGGEKSRVMLGKLLVTPVNLLLLDEPTNHLDMESTDALLAAINSFDGAVVLVTHNEMFLHALAERLIVFDLGGAFVYEGDYQRFLDHGGWEVEQTEKAAGLKERAADKPESKASRKELRRRRSEVIAERSRVLGPLKKRITELEHMIETQEQELSRLNSDMLEAVQNARGPAITELAQSIHTCQTEIDQLFNELAELTESCEAQEAVFEEKLQQIEE
nr:ATP-binding cassette domain-containing protein [Deltaproteobacteria bacterium]